MADEIQRVSESVAALTVKISMFKQCSEPFDNWNFK